MDNTGDPPFYPLNAEGKPIKREKSKLVALILTTFVSGLGHLYLGLWKRGAIYLTIEISIYIAQLVVEAFDDGQNSLYDAAYLSTIILSLLLWFQTMIGAVQWVDRNNDKWYRFNNLPRPESSHSKWIRPSFMDAVEKHQETERNFLRKRNPQTSLEEMINNPKKAIIRMSLIVSITYIVIKVNGFLDTFWVSQIGGAATAAVSAVNPLYTVVSSMGVGIGVGACICISYALGKNEYSRTQELSEAAIFMALAASIPTFLVLMVSIDPIVLVQDEEIAIMARQYVIPLAIGCPFIILSGVLTSLLKSEGAVAKMALCTLVSVPVNAILTPYMMNQLNMGVAGSSAATAVAMAVSAILTYLILKRGEYHFKVRVRLPTESSIKEIVGIGGPVAIDTFTMGILMLAQTVAVTIKTGSATLAVVELAFSFPYLLVMIPDSITSGSMPVCSALAGAWKIDAMKKSMGFSVKMTLILAILSAVVLFVFAEQILSLYTSGDTSGTTGELVMCARIYAVSLPFFLISRVFAGFLQTVRKAYISTPINILVMVIKIGTIYAVATDSYQVVMIELVFYVSLAILLGAVLIRSLRNYSPEDVDSMVQNKITFLWLVKRLVKTSG